MNENFAYSKEVCHHEIFEFWFFFMNQFPRAHPIGAVLQIFTKLAEIFATLHYDKLLTALSLTPAMTHPSVVATCDKLIVGVVVTSDK
jgi:hypothetical protein